MKLPPWPLQDYDRPPDWLAHFASDLADGRRWRVTVDNGGGYALAQREGRHPLGTEFWILRKGETHGSADQSLRLWTGRLNNAVRTSMIAYMQMSDAK